MDKCNYADKYKARRAPTCGCAACEVKWSKRDRQVGVMSSRYIKGKLVIGRDNTSFLALSPQDIRDLKTLLESIEDDRS